MDNAIIQGEYVTFKHVKTRKVVVLEIEINEESFQDVISKLGMPIGGESKPVAVALLDKQLYNKPPVVGKSDIQQTEGEKLRTRAVLLCDDILFHKYLISMEMDNVSDKSAREYICNNCHINSRSELATDEAAQRDFKDILNRFDAWKVSNRYANNLSR